MGDSPKLMIEKKMILRAGIKNNREIQRFRPKRFINTASKPQLSNWESARALTLTERLQAAEARAAVNNVERRKKWNAFTKKVFFWRKAPKPDKPKDEVVFKMVDFGIQNSLDGVKRGIFSIIFYALFPTISVAIPYLAPESWEWDDYYMDKPRKEKQLVQFEIDQLTGENRNMVNCCVNCRDNEMFQKEN